MIGGKNLSYCKSRPLTNKKANIKTHKYGVAILIVSLSNSPGFCIHHRTICWGWRIMKTKQIALEQMKLPAIMSSEL